MLHHVVHHVRKHSISVQHAVDGLVWALNTQPNYKIHLGLGLLSILGGFIYQITYIEWLTILMLIGGGLSIETINSSIEQTLDCVSLKKRNDIKIAKDASAAAMLIYAVFALLIASIIFLPRIFANG